MTEELEVKKPKEPKGFQPVGNQYLHGLPKRFLTLQEWRKYPKGLRELALKLGLYEVKYD
jgi:hypothetical protein